MASWLEMREARRLERGLKNDDETDDSAPVVPVSPTDVPDAEQVAPTEPETGDGDTGGGGGDAAPQPAPQEPAPAPEPAPTPAPPTTPPPTGGGGGGVSPGAGE
jgi:hypothetical protein